MQCSVSFLLTQTWDIDILLEKLTQEMGVNLKNTLCIMPLGWGFHANSVAWGQVNRLGVEETMYVAFSLLLYLWDLEKQKGKGFKVIIWRGKGKSHKEREFLWGPQKTTQGVDPSTSLSELPTYFSHFWCKKIYAQHSIPSK